MLLLLHANGGASPAVAQSAWGQTWDTEEETVSPWSSSPDNPWETEQSTGGETGNESLDGVPTWAVPHETPTGTWSPDIPGPSESESRYNIPRWDNAPHEKSSVGMNAPTNPNDPNKVPIDGGLGLLLVAGAGYAAHRLRSKEDDGEDAPLP